MRQLMREHIHPKHIIHLMHDENMKISCERSKENYTNGITSILDGRIACNVGGAQHRGPHMETQRGPSTDGACAGTISLFRSWRAGTSNNSSLQLVCHTGNISNHKQGQQYIQSQAGIHASSWLVHPHEITLICSIW